MWKSALTHKEEIKTEISPQFYYCPFQHFNCHCAESLGPLCSGGTLNILPRLRP